MRKKLIWAIDPFESPGAMQRQAERAIRALAARVEMDLEAVFVLSPSQLNISIEFSGPWIEQYRPPAEAALEAMLKRLKLDDIGSAHVIVQPLTSTAKAVDALVDYAKKSGADFILTSTHGRKGIRRLVMGSFAETLLLRSPVPVITAGPKFAKTEAGDHILFPTDLSQQSMEVFRQVVSFAAETRSRLTVFHVIPHPVEPILQSGAYLLGGSWVPVRSYFTQETERMKRKAQAWVRWAKNQKVQADLEIDSRIGSIGDAILEIAEKKAVSWIAMEADTGPVASMILGSITREVIRQSDRPVLVFRSYGIQRAARPTRRAAAA